MKSNIAILLVLALLLALTACSSGGDPAPAPTAAPASETPEDPGVPADTEPPASNGEILDGGLFTLTYDPEVWTYEEEDFYFDESEAHVMLIISEGEDSYVANVELTVSIEEPYSFRDKLVDYGFDEYEYAVNNAYDFTKIGGVDCLVHEGEYWGEPAIRYFNRIEGAGATVFLEIVGDYEDERVASLLEGLTIHLEDTGNVDGPWYWEGEAFSAEDRSVMVGTHTLNSQWIPFEECVRTRETFDHAVAVSGDAAYIASLGELKQYAFDGGALTFKKDIDVGQEVEYIQIAEDGSLWLSKFMEPLAVWKDGTQTASYEGPDQVAMHPSGKWGVNWFTSPECEKLSFSGGIMKTEPLTFSEVDTVMHLMVDENHIYVCGSAADDSGHKVFLYDKNGKLQMTLADENGESLGSVTFMAETKNGFIGLDGNMREVILWAKDGAYIGAADDGELFGTGYPWFCGGTVLPDGSILAIMTDDRADESAMELIAFRISGF